MTKLTTKQHLKLKDLVDKKSKRKFEAVKPVKAGGFTKKHQNFRSKVR